MAAAVGAADPGRGLPAGAAATRSSLVVAAGLLVVAVGIAIYAQSFGGPFIYDDVPSIVDNPRIHRLWPPRYLTSAPQQSTLVGRPLVGATLAMNYAVSRAEVWSYHAVNLAIHLACALLLMGLVRRTLLQPGVPRYLGESSGWLAAAVALLWVAHPMQTEAVAYVIQRTETLMALFYLLTLYAAVRGWSAESKRAAWVWQAISVAACALGMASKEVMVGAPLVVLLYDRAFVSGSFRGALLGRRRYYTALAMTWGLLVVLVAAGDRSASAGTHLGISPWSYLLTQAGVIVWYLRLSLWPDPLAVSYEDWPLAGGVGDVFWAALLVLGLLAAMLWALVKRPRVGFAGAFFFLILAPTSSIWPIATEPAAERRMYLPLAAIVLLLVLALHRATRRFGRAGTVALVLFVIAAVLVSGLAAARRVRDYRSTISIWQDCVETRPRNAAARNSLGQALARAGETGPAMEHLERAIRINPGMTEAYSNLGGLLDREGRTDEAIELLEKALSLDPERPAGIHNNLGVALARSGRTEAARRQFEEAIRSGDYTPDAHDNLGRLLAWQGDLPGAIAQFERVLEMDPARSGVARLLGEALCRSGRLEGAEELERRYRRLGDTAVADELAERIRLARTEP